MRHGQPASAVRTATWPPRHPPLFLLQAGTPHSTARNCWPWLMCLSDWTCQASSCSCCLIVRFHACISSYALAMAALGPLASHRITPRHQYADTV